MDTNSSGEDLFIKIRKPYTISKQRERWTEEEHNRFLEALKRYGRAWQRIEEHIGTKTAVQIRSHAQKFFTKLEKEALGKGVPIRQALDIEIPPPRPKRKPRNPYPRKTGVGAATPQVGATDGRNLSPDPSFFTGKQPLDLEREPLPEKPGRDEKPGNKTDNEDKGNCSDVLTLSQEASCVSLSSANKESMPTPVAPKKACNFREFVPMVVRNHNETNDSYVTIEPKENHMLVEHDAKQTAHNNGTNDTSTVKNPNLSHDKSVQSNKTNEMIHHDNFGEQHFPKNVPVHVLNGNLRTLTQKVSSDMLYQESVFHQVGGIHGNPNLFTNPAASSTATTEHHIHSSSIHQSFPPFHPLSTPAHNNQGDYQSYFPLSSAFSSLLVSTLLQNPAAHAAASFAAAFWPPATIEVSANSGILGGFPSRQVDPPPSVAAIVASTITAATAWWASHGLLPLCTPFHNGFNFAPASSTTATQADGGPAAACSNGKTGNAPPGLPLQNQQLDTQFSEPVQEQHSASKSPTSSSSDTGECKGVNSKTELTGANQEKAATVTELPDSNTTKGRKPVDRSSCGSNSSSDFETNALEKHDNEMEELKEADANLPAGDFCNRRCRPCSSTNDSWKEVSEEGRLAFRALFSRQVLPQSFSTPQDTMNKGYLKYSEKDKQNSYEKAEDPSQLDLNSKAWGTCSIHHPALWRGIKDGEGLLRMELGLHCRTGFKPYKRCSVEAKESTVANGSNQSEEKGPKRIRLEGEAST